MLYAVSYMPVKRHGWRILRRAQRKLNSSNPAARLSALEARAAALDWRPTDMRSFAEARLAHETQCSTDWAKLDDDRISISIHGVVAPVSRTRPYAELPADIPYLWQMSLGYLGYLLPACIDSDAETRQIFVDMAAGFANLESWSAPKAHDRHWHPYSASHRLINMIAGRQFLATYMSNEALAPLDRAIRICTQLISESTEYDIHYNHLTKNLMALIVSEAFRTGHVTAARFAEYRAAAEYQVLEDGGHAELCPMYHAQFLADLLVIRALPQKTMAQGMADWLSDITTRMQSAIRCMSHTDGDIALFGDSWRGEAPSSAFLAPGIFMAPPTAAHETLPYTGYTKLWGGAFCVLIDHGHVGADDNPGHAHDDALSIEVAVGGKRVVLDYGVESYAASLGRTRSRERAWHNAPTFDGDRGMDGWGAFRVGKRTRAPVWVRGGNDGWVWLKGQRFSLGYKGATTERLVLLHAEYGVVIRDRWLGPVGTSHFLMLPDAANRICVVSGTAETDQQRETFSLFGYGAPAVAYNVSPNGHEAIIVLCAEGRDPSICANVALKAFSEGSEIDH